MKCIFCSAPMPHKGLVCLFCGERNPLNLSSIDAKPIESDKVLKCPVCDIALERMDIGAKSSIFIQRCHECDGFFIGQGDLAKVVDNYVSKVKAIDYHLLRFVLDHPRHEKQKGLMYRRCPVCDQIMHRYNYKAISGVILDRCNEHGVWLDGGELQQIFEWKRVGGELKAIEQKPEKINHSFSLSETKSSSYFDPIESLFMWLYGM